MFQWEIKENPKWKTCFWEGGKNSSEFLNSCNEDNLIKIKAKLIKNLKVEVCGCITSLKHGRMGLLSLPEFLVIQTGDSSGSQWKCTAGLQLSATPFGLSALSYSSALLLLKKKISFSLLWVFLGMQLRDKAAEVYQFVTFIHGFHGSFFDLTILKWKKKACSHTSP